ncbi:hypothetical protein SADUNF_Sadunf16G0114700 [Salix dunnii]|uniref:Uncharacterized protein n=1 Tax=Salix dunnii TaxID=1413687 RepID=A0A835MLI2_9ROSI|nr:hypothetical protein SADUNF_Sadunf16G0114700 [Salix dunnii]
MARQNPTARSNQARLYQVSTANRAALLLVPCLAQASGSLLWLDFLVSANEMARTFEWMGALPKSRENSKRYGMVFGNGDMLRKNAISVSLSLRGLIM